MWSDNERRKSRAAAAEAEKAKHQHERQHGSTQVAVFFNYFFLGGGGGGSHSRAEVKALEGGFDVRVLDLLPRQAGRDELVDADAPAAVHVHRRKNVLDLLRYRDIFVRRIPLVILILIY